MLSLYIRQVGVPKDKYQLDLTLYDKISSFIDERFDDSQINCKPRDAAKDTVYAHEYMQYVHISLCPCLECDLWVDLHAYMGYHTAGSIQR